MKRSPLKRRTPLRATASPARSSSPTRRAHIRTVPVERDWRDALAKTRSEGACRVCGRRDDDLVVAGQHVEAAHTVGREHDRPHPDGPDGPVWVNPLAVVPLCTADHRAYDARRLDLLPFLTLPEQAHAVSLVGLMAALKRLTSNHHTGASR